MTLALRYHPHLGLVVAKPKRGPPALAGRQRPLPNVEIVGAQFLWHRPPYFDEAIIGASP
jgi:hypothetical protein